MNIRTRLTALVMALLMLISTPVSAWATTVDASTYAQWLQDAKTVSAQQQQLTTTSQEVLTSTEVTYTGATTDRNSTALSLSETSTEDTDLPQESITLPVAGSATLRAPGGAETYQWQVYVDGVWANILGDTAPSITMTYPMLSNALSGNSALVRCRMEQAGATVYSAETKVTVDHTITTTPYTTTQSIPVQATEYTTTRKVNNGIMLLSTAPQQTYLITIQYLFEDGTPAANPVIIQTGSSSGTHEYNGTVALPKVTGYEVQAPENLPAGVTYNAENKTLVFKDFSVTENKNIDVTYVPGMVNYTVVYFQQNVYGDSNEDYTKVEKDTLVCQGLTGDTVAEDLAPKNKYSGFRPLVYDTATPIAADGSTVVNVHYDRNYYLIKFELNGGTGIDPIYARYGSPITIGEPERKGYKFIGWDKELVESVPDENLTYTASWEAEETSFTVVYWLDDPNDNTEDLQKRKYNYWGSATKTALSGSIIKGETYNDYKNITDYEKLLNTFERQYSIYSHADTDVTINGDGTSVVNVYYNRKKYNLKFYYAMTSGSEADTKYYVIGGSTFRFGAKATISDTDNEIKLLDHYMNDYKSERGEVVNLPVLNEKGAARDYTHGSDSSTVSGTAYQYHYITFAAKYGADLTNLWPCDVFSPVTISSKHSQWNGMQAFSSAWNGEHHVNYSQKNKTGNQTIKGNYTMLDYQLLWDSQFGDPSDDTVSYLCFWENGVQNTWSIPELYVYNIYYQLLSETQDTTGLATETYKDKTYYLVSSYDTVDDSSHSNQTAPAIEGFNNAGYKWAPKDSFDTSLYAEAYDMYFFYDRNLYNLETHNAGTTKKEQNIPFGSSITHYFKDAPEHPDENLRDTHEFGGWYLDPDCVDGTEFDISANPTMPAHNLMLYAKWNLVKHHVNVYLTKAHMEANSQVDGQLLYSNTVEHGSFVPEDDRPVDPVNGEYKFVHWFYEVDNGDGTKTEYPYDFASIPVNHDLNIYAKWSTDVIMNYKVYYVKKGTGEAIGDTTEFVADLSAGSALAGTSKTFYAKGVTDLYPEYQTGWFPETQSHTIAISIEENQNSYTFEYVPVDQVPYRVCYVDENGNELHSAKDVLNNDKAVVTETFVLIPGYVPDALQKRLVVAYDESAGNSTPTKDNTITFVYEKDEESAMYVINHYLTDHTGNVTLHSYEASTVTMTMDKSVTVQAEKLSLPGYAFNRVDCKIAEKDDKTTYDEGNLSVTMKMGSAGFVMDLYYQEQTATINYLVASGCESMGSVSLASETLGVVTGNPAGSAPTANANYKFAGWFSDAACTQPVVIGVAGDGTLMPTRNSGTLWANTTYYAKFVLNVADLTITKKVEDGNTGDDFSPAASTEFSFLVQISGQNYTGSYSVNGSVRAAQNGLITLKAGETASISNVTIGEAYTVTEQALPAGYLCQNTSASGTINATSNAVVTTNTYEVRSLTINKAVKGGDAPRGEVFYFNVTLPNGSYATLTDGSMQSTLTVANGQATVLLTAGQTVVISGIPYGAEYAVTEQAHADYSTEVAGASSGRLNTDVSMTFTNTYLYSHLTVKKEGMTQGSAIVRITVNGVTYPVVLNSSNNWTQIIARLPIGKEITVEEDTDWSWRYGSTPVIVKSDKVTEGGASVTINNRQTETKWLDDETAVTNAFTGTSSH